MMRVVLASEVDATKLVGGPSRDVKSGTECESPFSVDGAGSAGVDFGTRRKVQHADALRATISIHIDALRRRARDR
jgi:hypothetical protein